MTQTSPRKFKSTVIVIQLNHLSPVNKTTRKLRNGAKTTNTRHMVIRVIEQTRHMFTLCYALYGNSFREAIILILLLS